MDEERNREAEKLVYDRFGIRILRAENGEAEAEIKLRAEDRNLMGLPFGGVLFNLADCTAGAAVRSLGCFGMTVTGESRFLRGSRDTERLVCRASIRKNGRSLGFVDAAVEDENGRELAAFSFTFMNYHGSL